MKKVLLLLCVLVFSFAYSEAEGSANNLQISLDNCDFSQEIAYLDLALKVYGQDFISQIKIYLINANNGLEPDFEDSIIAIGNEPLRFLDLVQSQGNVCAGYDPLYIDDKGNHTSQVVDIGGGLLCEKQTEIMTRLESDFSFDKAILIGLVKDGTRLFKANTQDGKYPSYNTLSLSLARARNFWEGTIPLYLSSVKTAAVVCEE